MAGRNESRIVAHPDYVHGKPRVAGTRIRVTDVLEYLASGMTPQEIVADFPELTDQDIRACLEFAARSEDHPVLIAG